MKSEETLHALSRLPRPELRPFFPARTTAAIASSRPAVRRPAIMTVYWLLVAFLAGTLLSGSWLGLAILATAGLVVAFPEEALRTLLRVIAPLTRA